MSSTLVCVVALLLALATSGEGGVLLNKTDSNQSTEAVLPEIETPVPTCQPGAELIAGVCKCNGDFCEKPPCDKFLNPVIDVADKSETCCPTYSCDDCIDKFLIDGKCVCPENAAINLNGICECNDRYKSIQNNSCQCDLNKCPLPNLCDERSVGIEQLVGCCTFIECVTCPEDSYPKKYNTDIIDDKCVCYKCPDTTCEKGYVPKHIKRGHNIPSDCCDVYECSPELPPLSCFFEEEIYENGDNWSTLEQYCSCENGVAGCRPISTTTLPEKNCFVNYTVYHHLESWLEDECTNCTCHNGEPKCVAHFCHTKVSVITPECPELNCKKYCKYGFKSKKGCHICKCKLPDKMNKEMDIFMRNHNLTEDDVLAILEMYIANKYRFREHTSTTTTMPNEIYKMPPKYELLEMFMHDHNLTEKDVLEMLNIHLQNKYVEPTTKIKDNVPSISSMPSDISPTDNIGLVVWFILIAVVFVVGSVFGWAMHICKRYFWHNFTCEETQENNNVVVKKFSRTPMEQIQNKKLNNEKKPLTTT